MCDKKDDYSHKPCSPHPPLRGPPSPLGKAKINPNLYKKDAREDLEAEYRIYHALGKNGVMDGRRAKFLNLPYEPVEKA